MPLLAYCIIEATRPVETPSSGVGGQKLEELLESGLRCFFSRFQNGEQISRTPAVESALAFHQVVQDLFRQAALISFRFPTVLENEEELLRHLRERAPQYTGALSRLRHMVQMEVHIRGGSSEGSRSQPVSGSEYLRERRTQSEQLKVAAEQFHQTTRPWTAEWRERATAEGVRCYALLHRDAVTSFQSAAQALSQKLPGTRLSGPWPPAEFLEIEDS